MARRSSKSSNGKDKDQETPQDDLAGEAVEPAQSEGVDAVASETEPGAAETEATPDAGETRPDTAAPEATEDGGEPASQADTADASGTDGTDTVEAEPLDPETAAAETTEPESVTPDAEDGTDTSQDETADRAAQGRDAEAGDDAQDAQVDTAHSEPPPELEKPAEPAATRTVVERRGPGFVPLVLGGVVAAALGYFASIYEVIPGLGGDAGDAELQAALDRQSETLAALQQQVSEIGAAEAPQVDLSPVTDQIAALGTRLDETASSVEALSERVSTLEDRPVFSGDVTADTAQAAEALAEMEEQMRQQEEEAARLAAEAQQAQEQAANAIAEAEAEAQTLRARAVAETALQSVRLALAEGEPYAEPLATLSDTVDIPGALADNAENGVASLESLQDDFPPAARDALPVALRETAGDGALDRFTAFLQGQVAGRAIEPIEGDGPDAILSRAQAAVSGGDLETALAEISALPEAAQAEMADWVSRAETRVEVTAALESVAQALSGTN